VRGNGHGADLAGAGEDGGAVIVLTRMHSVHVDVERRVVRVDGGARLGDIDAEVGACSGFKVGF
jgi:FAD/FMN-containing dehydrogenase